MSSSGPPQRPTIPQRRSASLLRGLPPGSSVRLPRSMGLVLTTTFALVIWIVLWACGAKSFDAFLVATVIITLGATGRILKPYLPGRE